MAFLLFGLFLVEFDLEALFLDVFDQRFGRVLRDLGQRGNGGGLRCRRRQHRRFVRMRVAELVGKAVPDIDRFGQAARTEFAARHRTLARIDHADPRFAQPLDIALGRGVFPHPHVHRGHDNDRLVGGEQQGGGEIVGDPGAHLRQQVGCGGADDDEVGFARELDMSHLAFALQIPQRGIDRVFRERRERHRGDELAPALGQHAGDRAALPPDHAHQLARLVGRDTAADHEQDLRAALAHARCPVKPILRELSAHAFITALASVPRPTIPAPNIPAHCHAAPDGPR